MKWANESWLSFLLHSVSDNKCNYAGENLVKINTHHVISYLIIKTSENKRLTEYKYIGFLWRFQGKNLFSPWWASRIFTIASTTHSKDLSLSFSKNFFWKLVGVWSNMTFFSVHFHHSSQWSVQNDSVVLFLTEVFCAITAPNGWNALKIYIFLNLWYNILKSIKILWYQKMLVSDAAI